MSSSTCRYMRGPASWLSLLLMLFVIRTSAAAQVADLSAFQDSVTRISDVATLRAMLSHRSGHASQESPADLTQRGFVAFRLWQLTAERSQSKLAQESFKQALKRDPVNGWAHYGLGLTYMQGPSADPGSFVLDDVFAGLTGNDARSRAHREFTQAVMAEPPVSRATQELAENALAKNKRNVLQDARSVLQKRVASTPEDGTAWFALSEVQSELGELDSARVALESAAARGVNSSEASHVRAALLLRMRGHEAEGKKAWFDGVSQLTAPVSEIYFNDIEALLSKDERAAWQRMDLSRRADYLRSFWDVRAAMAGVTVDERLAEHYRRLAFVREQYFRQNRFGAPDQNALRQLPYSQRAIYDDRGLIYIRHGAPFRKVGAHAGSEFESWAYKGVDGDQAYHFWRDSDGEDYHLMHKLNCDPAWLNEAASIDRNVGRLAASCTDLNVLSVSADARQVAFAGLASESDSPHFVKDLPFFFDLFTFRASEGRTSVVAAVAVPRDKLNMTEVASNPAYRIDLSLILVDTLTRKVIREDDSLMLATERLRKDDDLFRLHVEIALPPSKSIVQRLIISDPTEPGVGQLYGGPFPVPDYTGSKLMLSDIVLAEPGVKGKWHRGNVSLALVPTRYFKGGKFSVFYEVYNIAPNAHYSTEIEIEPVLKSTGQKLKGIFGSKGTVRFKFEGEATDVKDGTMQELRRMDAPLGAGVYRMRVTVKNLENGETAHNERTFSIPS